MPYFSDHQSRICYPLQEAGKPGLRRSQLGAIHAIGAHFALHEQPGLIVLPTGAGKTAVLTLAPFTLSATRVLVVTQSRFVRRQIYDEFRTLKQLKAQGVVPADVPMPNVLIHKERVGDLSDWEAMRDFDVVVSTPSSSSPGLAGVSAPPKDLFDLVLIDEAHHSPAPTWNAILAAFAGARCVLLTATPFRRDGREIKARNLFTYPIQRAYDDGIYGDMSFQPVDAVSGELPDVTLARAAAATFESDRKAGFVHAIMVRADSRPRAAELMSIYAEHTDLRLDIVDSGKSPTTVERVVKRLRAGDLDGVICVNMLGEGFDLPRLKIAALHAPHRSMAVTLQFFGRFARMNGEALGVATFLGVRDEVENALGALFEESDAWGAHIRAVGHEHVVKEEMIRQALDTFAIGPDTHETAPNDISLYSFDVFNHVKIFQLHGKVRLDAVPALSGFSVLRTWQTQEHSSTVFLAREVAQPQWTTAPGLERTEHHLFIVFYDAHSGLLFVCATCREEPVYKEISELFVDGHAQPLSLNRANRVLRSFSDLELFNVGIRNRATGIVAESYRQLSGSAAHLSLTRQDAALYHRGHVFGRGQSTGSESTIGLSSSSKVWRLKYSKIPELIDWCRSMARQIESAAPVKTGLELDYYDAGQDVTALPGDVVVIAADWYEELYLDGRVVTWTDPQGQERSSDLLDFELRASLVHGSQSEINIVLSNGAFESTLRFSLSPYPSLRYLDATQARVVVKSGFKAVDLLAFLSSADLRFFLSDGSVLQGCELFGAGVADDQPYEADLMIPLDWEGLGVKITKELGPSTKDGHSLHSWLCSHLLSSGAAIIFFDHGTGELADFVTFARDPSGEPLVTFYHCKGSGGEKPGDRVDDLYEVCGQAIKSTFWRNRKQLLQRMKHREQQGSSFVRGSMAEAEVLLGASPVHSLELQIVVVQPGLSKKELSKKLGSLLAATSRSLLSSNCKKLQTICSP